MCIRDSTEGPEDFNFTISNPVSDTGALVDTGTDVSVTTTIDDVETPGGTDADGPAEWTLTGPTSIDEGEDAVFTLALSETFGENENAKIDIAFDQLTTNPNDYGDVIAALQAAADANPDVTFTPNATGDGGTFEYLSLIHISEPTRPY